MSSPQPSGPNSAPSRLPALGEAWFRRFAKEADELTARRATLGLATLAILSAEGPDPRPGLGAPAETLAELGLPPYADALDRIPLELRTWALGEVEALGASGPHEIEALGDVFEATLGASRRSTGSHFTPRDLTRETVARALAPLVDFGEVPLTPSRILSLRVCDPAMGGGAFLLEVCRQLARALDAATGHTGENGRPCLAAIAEHCLFGLDRDAIAVEVARISLWLLVRPERPPLAYASRWLRHGDALVGASRTQIESFRWDDESAPSGPPALVAGRDADAHRAVGDLLVDAFFSSSSPGDRRARRERRLVEVRSWLRSGEAALPASLERRRVRAQAKLLPFHWAIDQPAPFDAFVGNPPFLGGKRISTVHGAPYAEWLHTIHRTSKNADLCVHFFRRAAGLLASKGTVSFIATNTISQGDTRTSGLAALLDDGFLIYRAVRSQRWPGAAKVSVSVVHLQRGLDPLGPPELDGRVVAHVDSRLRARAERPDPARLLDNEGKAFVGCFLRGDGFILPPALREELTARTPSSAHLIRPYIGGEEVNTSPTQSFFRYVIDFGEMSLPEAMAHEVLLDTLRARVKPGRDRLRDDGADIAHKRAWWRFANARPELRAALAPLDRCLVAARVTKHLSLSFQPVSRVFSEQLVVFAFDSYAHFAVLESRIHEVWARLLSSSLGEGLRYLPSEAFDSFPFPEPRHLARGGALDKLGQRLNEARADRLIEGDFGLTTLKNQLLDRFVADAGTRRLRALYEELDRCVLDAYGLGALDVPSFAAPLSEADRAPLSAYEDAVVEHLYAANRDKSDGGVRPDGV